MTYGPYVRINCILVYACMYTGLKKVLKKNKLVASTIDLLKLTTLYFQTVLMNLPHF